MRIGTASGVTAIALALGACASVYNLPLNVPSAMPVTGGPGDAVAVAAAKQKQISGQDDTVIALSFSGGGTRAAAFAYGVLYKLAQTPSSRGDPHGRLIDHIGLVSGVSGGSIMAAYYGLKGKAALTDFRQQFLTQDVMASLDTDFNVVNISRALGGGVNTDNKLRDWFNAHLFHDATLGDLAARQRPIVVINATDTYNRTPFLFAPQTFAAACSSFDKYPVAAAVAASAAVPAAFAPVVIETYPGACRTPLPSWVDKAADNAAASPLLQNYAKALKDIRAGKLKYIKLFDGGLVDNYGLSGITIMRAASSTPYGPLRPEEAINLRRIMFLVVDAGQTAQGDWTKTLEGPAGKDLVGAVVDVLIDANSHASYAAFEATMKNWHDDIVRWRCGLKSSEVARLRARPGPWSCRDLQITVGRVSFEQLERWRARELGRVPTTFTLPAATVDALARAGSDALEANPAFQAFVSGK
jgi:NTE family protein